MKDTTISVDLAKSVFELAVSDRPGHVKSTHRLPRGRFLSFFVDRAPAQVIMEACGSAYFWARKIQQLGHEVVLLPPHAIRPYVPRNKTDRADAKGLLEASRNKEIHPVPLKTEAQQTIAALHRIRSVLLATRSARINTVRGLLREFGVVMPLGAKLVVPTVLAALEDADSGLPDVLRPALAAVCDEIRDLESKIRDTETQLNALA